MIRLPVLSAWRARWRAAQLCCARVLMRCCAEGEECLGPTGVAATSVGRRGWLRYTGRAWGGRGRQARSCSGVARAGRRGRTPAMAVAEGAVGGSFEPRTSRLVHSQRAGGVALVRCVVLLHPTLGPSTQNSACVHLTGRLPSALDRDCSRPIRESQGSDHHGQSSRGAAPGPGPARPKRREAEIDTTSCCQVGAASA